MSVKSFGATVAASLFGTSEGVFTLFKSPQNRAAAPYVVEGEEASDDEKFALWGKNDDLPVKLAEDVECDTTLAPGMNFLSSMQYGAGLAHGQIDIVDGKEAFSYRRDDDVIDFMRRDNLDFQLYTLLHDLNQYHIAYIQFAFNRERSQIVEATVEKNRAKWCRVGRKLKGGDPDTLYINPDFGTQNYKEANTVKVPLAPSYDPAGWVKKQVEGNKNFHRFAVAVRLVDSGRKYYPRPAWNSVRKSGWLEISQALADYKKHLLENQLSIKYHVEVHEKFWEVLHGSEQWNTKTPAEKLEAKTEWVKGFSEHMAGVKGAGNTLMTSMVDGYQGIPDKAVSLVKINVIDDKFLKEGVHIEDSREAALHKMSALNIHPELIGATPASQMSSGSGSGSRVAFNQRVSMAKSYQDFALHPLGIVRDVNGWDSKLVFRMRNSLITTLDTGASATKPSAE